MAVNHKIAALRRHGQLENVGILLANYLQRHLIQFFAGIHVISNWVGSGSLVCTQDTALVAACI